jgi:MFS family permease
MTQRALRCAFGLLILVAGIALVAIAILTPALPLELVLAAWSLAGFGIGLAYPAATLTALGVAASGQEGAAASSLQVAETVGTAIGTGAAGALFALSSELQRGAAEGLAWGFVLTAAAVLAALVPALRMAPLLRWPNQPHAPTQFPLPEPVSASAPPG